MTRHDGTLAHRRSRADWDELVLVALASVWQCRLELALVIGAVSAQRVAVTALGDWRGTVLVVLLVAVAGAFVPCRRLMCRSLRRASI